MSTRADIEELVRTWELRVSRAFLEAVSKIRDEAQVEAIVRLIQAGDLEGAVQAVGLDPASFRPVDKAVADAFEAGGEATSGSIPRLRQPSGYKLSVLFNARNPDAEQWLRDHSSKLVKELVDDQRATVRQTLAAGMEAGRNPRDVALDLVGRVDPATGRRVGGTIGLTSTQESWARNYAQEVASNDPRALGRKLRDKRFDRAIQKAIQEGKPLDAATQAKVVQSYRNRALKARADTLGRTEAMTSIHQAQDESYKQAVMSGKVRRQDVRKVWRSAGDDRVRHTHRELNGQSVGFDQSFKTSSGVQLRFPGDPLAAASEVVNCRCTCEYRVDYLANVA